MTEVSEMILRVAVAIAGRRDAFAPGEKLAQGYLDDALVAIEAMREPTEAMGWAGLLASSHDPISGNEKLSGEAAEKEKIGWADSLRANPSKWNMPIWRAMIDAALA